MRKKALLVLGLILSVLLLAAVLNQPQDASLSPGPLESSSFLESISLSVIIATVIAIVALTAVALTKRKR